MRGEDHLGGRAHALAVDLQLHRSLGRQRERRLVVPHEDAAARVAAIEQAAIQASCETRRLVGQQAQAFTVAALPLCRTV